MKDLENMIRKVVEYQNNYDSDRMLPYFTDDVTFVVLDDNSTYVKGKKNLKAMIDETKVEDRYHWTLDQVTTTQDKIIALETLEKPQNIKENYIFIYEVDHDHISKVWMTSQ